MQVVLLLLSDLAPSSCQKKPERQLQEETSTFHQPSTAGAWSTVPEHCPATATLGACPWCPRCQALHCLPAAALSTPRLCSPASRRAPTPHSSLNCQNLPRIPHTLADCQLYEEHTWFLRHTVRGHLPPILLYQERVSKKK